MTAIYLKKKKKKKIYIYIYIISQREIKVKTGRLLKVRENAGVKITIGFRFASRQISEQSKAKPKKVLITFDAYLKMTFNKL